MLKQSNFFREPVKQRTKFSVHLLLTQMPLWNTWGAFFWNEQNSLKQYLRKTQKFVIRLKCNTTQAIMWYVLHVSWSNFTATSNANLRSTFDQYWDIKLAYDFPIWNTLFYVALAWKLHWKQISKMVRCDFGKKAIRTMAIMGTAMLHKHWE